MEEPWVVDLSTQVQMDYRGRLGAGAVRARRRRRGSRVSRSPGRPPGAPPRPVGALAGVECDAERGGPAAHGVDGGRAGAGRRDSPRGTRRMASWRAPVTTSRWTWSVRAATAPSAWSFVVRGKTARASTMRPDGQLGHPVFDPVRLGGELSAAQQWIVSIARDSATMHGSSWWPNSPPRSTLTGDVGTLMIGGIVEHVSPGRTTSRRTGARSSRTVPHRDQTPGSHSPFRWDRGFSGIVDSGVGLSSWKW